MTASTPVPDPTPAPAAAIDVAHTLDNGGPARRADDPPPGKAAVAETVAGPLQNWVEQMVLPVPALVPSRIADVSPASDAELRPDLEAVVAAVEARVAAAVARAELAEAQLAARQVVVDEHRAQHDKDLVAIAAKNETLARVMRTAGISDALKREAERSKAL